MAIPVSKSCLTIWNRKSLSSSETGVHRTIWRSIKALSCPTPGVEILWSCLIERDVRKRGRRAETQQPRLGIWHFQTPAWKRFFKIYLTGEQFVFWGRRRSFLKDGFETYPMAMLKNKNKSSFLQEGGLIFIFPHRHDIQIHQCRFCLHIYSTYVNEQSSSTCMPKTFTFVMLWVNILLLF